VIATDEKGDAAWSRWTAGVILGGLFALSLYRAATQSFVHDESLWFQYFIDGPISCVFNVPADGYADPSFFFTVMMRAASECFGNSEFSLRLPSVLLGGVYFVSIYRLCRIVFQDAWLFLIAVLIACGNPLVLDFAASARGYGPALSFLTYAILQVVLYFREPPGKFWHPRLVKAGLATGLSFAANVTLWPACVAITFAVTALLWLRARNRRDVWRPAVSYFGALSVVAYLFLLISPSVLAIHDFRHSMNPNRMPDDSLLGMIRELSQNSLAHNAGLGGINSFAALDPLRGFIGIVLVPLAVVISGWFGWQWLRRDPDASAPALFAALASTIVIGAALESLYGHWAFDLIMPHGRYALYLLPLAGLSLISAADFLRRERGFLRAASRIASNVFFTGAVLAVLFFAAQLNWTHFLTWQYDADTRALLQQVAARVGDDARPHVVVGGSWFFEPTANYYRITKHWTWMFPVTRHSSDSPSNFYLFTAEDNSFADRLHLKRIAQGQVSGALLAAAR